jgi:hypothetical protein
MSVLKPFELTLPEVSFKFGPDPAVGQADSGDLADDLRDVLVAVGEAAAEAGTGFALILDEVQNLSADPDRLARLTHGRRLHRRP